MGRRAERLAPLLLVAAIGCAPPVSLRPITPFAPDRNLEVGLGYGLVSPRPVGQDPWRGAPQGWATLQPALWLDLSVVGGFDGEAATGGLGARLRVLELSRFALGAGVEVGSGFLAVELPVAVAVHDAVWVYTAPQYGTWGFDAAVRLPLGLDIHLDEPFRLRTEAQVNYPDFDPYRRRFHFGLGVAYQH